MWEKAYWIWRKAGSYSFYFTIPYMLLIGILDLWGFSQKTQGLVAIPFMAIVGVWTLFPIIAIATGIISVIAESDRRMREIEDRRKWEMSRQKWLFEK